MITCICHNIKRETRLLSRRQPKSKFTSMVAIIERARALAMDIKMQDTTSDVDLNDVDAENLATMTNFCDIGLHEMGMEVARISHDPASLVECVYHGNTSTVRKNNRQFTDLIGQEYFNCLMDFLFEKGKQ